MQNLKITVIQRSMCQPKVNPWTLQRCWFLWPNSTQSYRGWQTLLLGLPQSWVGIFGVECTTYSQVWVQKPPEFSHCWWLNVLHPGLVQLWRKGPPFPTQTHGKQSPSSAANLLCRRSQKWPTVLYQRLCWGLPSMKTEQPRTPFWTYKSFFSNQTG